MGLILATTTGQDIRDSARSRANANPSSCEITLVPDGGDRPQFMGLVARYLNAARVGHAAAVADATANACTDCRHRQTCHEVFGAHEGRGVFPLSTASIRAAERALEETADGTTARQVLNSLVKPVLHHAPAALAALTFPIDAGVPNERSDALVRLLREAGVHPSADQRAMVEALANGDRRVQERLQALLLHWGIHDDAQVRMPDLLSFPRGLVEAPLPVIDADPQPFTEPDPQPPEEDRLIEFVRGWADREDPQAGGEFAVEIRRIAHTLLKTLSCWEELILLSRTYWDDNTAIDACCADLIGVRNYGIHNQTIALGEAGNALCSFTHDAAGQGELEALVRWHDPAPQRAIERAEAATDRVNLAALRWRMERDVRARLYAHAQRLHDDHSGSLAGLSFAVASADPAADRPTTIETLEAPGRRPVAQASERAWRDAVEASVHEFEHLSAELLRYAGRAQGLGTVTVVDPAIAEFGDVELPPLSDELQEGVDDQIRLIELHVDQADEVRGDTSLVATRESMLRAVERIERVGDQPIRELAQVVNLDLGAGDDGLLARASAVVNAARDAGVSHSTVRDLRKLDPEIERLIDVSEALDSARTALHVEIEQIADDIRENDQALRRGTRAIESLRTCLERPQP